MVRNAPERNTLVLGISAAFLAGASTAISTPLALSIAGLGALLLAATSLRPHHAVALLVLTSYMTRVRIPVAGFGFRLEHVATAVLLTVVLVRRRRQVGRAIRQPAVVFLLLFIAWSGLVSFRAPDVPESMQIVGWLLIDAALVVALVASGRSGEEIWESLVRYGLWASAYGVGTWIAATAFGTSAGVQVETLTGAPAVYGLSFEANIYGSTLALLLVGLICLGVPRRLRAPVYAVYGLPLAALLLSFTRAAMLGLLLGMALWVVLSRSLRVRARILGGALAAGFVLTLIGLAAPGVISPFAEKASQAVDFADGTGAVRTASWSMAVGDLDATDLVVGRGANSYGQYHFDPTLPGLDRPGYIGNLPLQLVYDTGLVGVSLVLASAFLAVPRSSVGRRRASVLMVVYLTVAVATSPFWFATTWIYFAMGVLSQAARRQVRVGQRPSDEASVTAIPAS